MSSIKDFFDGVANVAQTISYGIRLHSNSKDDIYHEWFSTLRIRHIKQMDIVESKLNSKIVQEALEDIFKDMLQVYYQKITLKENDEYEMKKDTLIKILREFFTFEVITLFTFGRSNNIPDEYDINMSLFFHCLINAVETSFNIDYDDAKKLLREAVSYASYFSSD